MIVIIDCPLEINSQRKEITTYMVGEIFFVSDFNKLRFARRGIRQLEQNRLTFFELEII